MSLERTLKDTNRLYPELKKYPVFEALPAYFEQEYPKLVHFLETYYEEAGEETVEEYIEDLQYKRDFVSAGEDLLRFFSKELLLGRDYFDTFIDKQTAIQTSNLLYRSKGTHYSIQQFFRIFFGFDVDVRYGRDEVFLVGDPFDETVVYKGQYKSDGTYYPGDRLRFTFDDGPIIVSAVSKLPKIEKNHALYIEKYNTIEPYVEDVDDYVEPFEYKDIYDYYYDLRQDVDYYIDYADKSVVLLDNVEDPVVDDPWINYLAETGRIAEGASVKIKVLRNSPAGSAVGPEVTNKMITNNAFYQLFALAITAPISIKKWKEPYKDFVHPAGMYLESTTSVESSVKMKNPAVDTILFGYRKVVEDTAQLLEFVSTTLTELTVREFKLRNNQALTKSGYSPGDHLPLHEQEWEDSVVAYDGEYYSEFPEDSDRQNEVYRSRLNDIKNIDATLEDLDRQYIRMSDIDEINSRRMNETFSDMSQTINTMDENFWNKDRVVLTTEAGYQVCEGQLILGDQLDFPPEYAGCPNFIFGIGVLRPEKYLRAQFESPKMMNQIPTYQVGDSSGFGQEFPYIRAYDSIGEPGDHYLFDSDGSLLELRDPSTNLRPAPQQTRSEPGAVAGYALQKYTAYGLEDSAQYSVVDGIGMTYRNYFQGPYTDQYYMIEVPKGYIDSLG